MSIDFRGFIQNILRHLGPPTTVQTQESCPTPRRSTPRPEFPKTTRGNIYRFFNGEGEIQEIDTGDSRGPFHGENGERFCKALTEHGVILGRVVGRRMRAPSVDTAGRSSERTVAGWDVRLEGIDLGTGANARERLAFLPGRNASEFDPSVDPLGRYCWIEIKEFDKNTMNVVVEEMRQAVPLQTEEQARQFLARATEIAEHARSGEPVRGTILRVARHRAGDPSGLLVDVDGHQLFVPAEWSLGLAHAGETTVIGLAVSGVVRSAASSLRLRLSLDAACRRLLARRPQPQVACTTEGIAWLVEGDDWMWLLPGEKIGVASCRSLSLDPRSAKGLCGYAGMVKIVGRMPATQATEPPNFRIVPVFD